MLALGALVEPPLLALAHGRRLRPMLVAGFGGVAVACCAAAWAPSYPLLVAALLCYGPATGVGVRLSEAALMASHPDARETMLARWTLWSLAGDLLAPILVAASTSMGLGLKGALWTTALWAAAQAVLVSRAPIASGVEEDGELPCPPLQALREALTCMPLVGWSLAAVLCNLMDEVLVSFGALHLEALGATPGGRAVTFTAWIAGSALGAVTLERLANRLPAGLLLLLSGAGAAVAYTGWLLAGGWPAAALALGATGFFAAAHHPLLTARAYATLPDRPSTVAAVSSLVAVLDLGVPVIIGLIADAWGVGAALVVLLVQPAGVIAAAAVARASRRQESVAPDA